MFPGDSAAGYVVKPVPGRPLDSGSWHYRIVKGGKMQIINTKTNKEDLIMNNRMNLTNGQAAGNFGISKAGGKRSFSRKKEESLFSFFFKQKSVLLDLYSYIYQDASVAEDDIEIVDLSQTSVEGYEDIGFITGGRLVIIAEQASVKAPNNAARMLFHTTGTYQKIIDGKDTKLYGEEGVDLPEPEFLSFYVGPEEFTETTDELFKGSGSTKFKLSVRTYDGKHYGGSWLMPYCKLLDSVQGFLSEGFSKDAACRMAIRTSSDSQNKTFASFLKENEETVFELLYAKLDRNDYLTAQVTASVEVKLNSLEEQYTKAGRDSMLVSYVNNRRSSGCKDDKILNELLGNFNLDQAEAVKILASA